MWQMVGKLAVRFCMSNIQRVGNTAQIQAEDMAKRANNIIASMEGMLLSSPHQIQEQ